MKLLPFASNPSVSLRGGENRERKGVCGDGSFCPEEYPAGAWRAVGRCFADRLCPRCRGGSDAGTFRLRAGHSAGGVPVFGGFGIPGGGARGRGTGGPPFRGDAILLPAARGCGAGPADELDRGVSRRGQNAGRAAAAGGPYRAGNGGSGPGADLQRAGLYGRGGGRPHFRLHGGGDFFVPVPAGGGSAAGAAVCLGPAAAAQREPLAVFSQNGAGRGAAGTVGGFGGFLGGEYLRLCGAAFGLCGSILRLRAVPFAGEGIGFTYARGNSRRGGPLLFYRPFGDLCGFGAGGGAAPYRGRQDPAVSAFLWGTFDLLSGFGLLWGGAAALG